MNVQTVLLYTMEYHSTLRRNECWVGWLTSVILASLEVEITGIVAQGHLEQSLWELVSPIAGYGSMHLSSSYVKSINKIVAQICSGKNEKPYPKIISSKKGRGHGSTGTGLPSKFEVLSSTPNTTKRRKRKDMEEFLLYIIGLYDSNYKTFWEGNNF